MTDAGRDILAAQLRADEALRLFPYVDLAGKLTIGYGRNLDARGITLDEADLLLQHDIDVAVDELFKIDPVVATLDAVRQIVLANMCFNLGALRLRGFVLMWACLRGRNYEGAAREMLDSDWARQVGARARRLATAMATGTFAKKSP